MIDTERRQRQAVRSFHERPRPDPTHLIRFSARTSPRGARTHLQREAAHPEELGRGFEPHQAKFHVHGQRTRSAVFPVRHNRPVVVLVPRQIRMVGMTGGVPYYGGRFTPAQAYAAAHPPRPPAPPPAAQRRPRLPPRRRRPCPRETRSRHCSTCSTPACSRRRSSTSCGPGSSSDRAGPGAGGGVRGAVVLGGGAGRARQAPRPGCRAAGRRAVGRARRGRDLRDPRATARQRP